MESKPKNILIIKYRALGDSIMGLSTISYLRSIYPDSKIYYAVRDWTAALYKEVETDADEVIPLSLNSFKDYMTTWKKLKSLDLDHIHELHLSGRTKKFCTLYSLLTSTKYTYHNHHLNTESSVIDHGVMKPLIQRDLDGVYTFLGQESERPSYLNFVPTLKLTVKKEDQIIFGVVATRQTKMWDLLNYVKLANRIKELFPHIKIIVPLATSLQDLEIKTSLLELDKDDNLEIIHEPLNKLPYLIGKSRLYIGNDTGLKHLAIATGVKSYTFFGPEPPLEWHPYNSDQHPFFYIDGLECRTRDAHYCGLSTCDSMICLKDIAVEKVIEAIREDLS